MLFLEDNNEFSGVLCSHWSLRCSYSMAQESGLSRGPCSSVHCSSEINRNPSHRNLAAGNARIKLADWTIRWQMGKFPRSQREERMKIWCHHQIDISQTNLHLLTGLYFSHGDNKGQ